MDIRKRLLATVLALGLAGSFAGCGQTEQAATPITPAPTEATVPLFEREYTQEEQAILQERRDIAESYMRESLSLLWKADENIIYGLAARDNGIKLYLIEGRIYQGLPYAYAVGTQDSFLEYATGGPDEHGVYTISGLEATAINYESYGARVGNDCSGVLTNAWSQIGTSFTTSMSSTMFQDYGVLPLGDYDFCPTIDPEANRISYTDVVTNKNGPLTMYKSYALLQKADCLFRQAPSSNHSMMVVDVNVVYTSGGVIDGTKSTVTVLEQSRRNQNQQKRYDHPELGEVFLIGCIDEVYTFAQLFSGTYLPVTIKEFHDPSPLEEPWVKDSLEAPNKDNLFTGNITSNWYIDCVTVTISDEEGNTSQEVTGRARRRYNKDFDMTRFVTENPGACLGSVDLSKLETGTYKCTVTARLTTGKTFTARTFDFTV